MAKLKRSRASIGNYFWLWHTGNHGPGIKALISIWGRGFDWPSAGFSKSANPLCSSGGIPERSLFLAVAACNVISTSLVQPSELFQGFSITRARRGVPKAGGVLLRLGHAGLTPTGSQPLGNRPCTGNRRAEQNHPPPHKKPQMPKTDCSPRDRPISQTDGGKTRGSAASTPSCQRGPQRAPAPLWR